MITLSAEIKIKEGGQITNGYINEPSSEKSNVSCEFSDILNNRATGKNLFFTDYSIVDSGAVYGDKVNYYISGRASDINLSFSPAYVITLNNYNYNYVIIEFDKLNKEYPQSIIVNGKTYTDNDPVWEIGNIPKTSDNKVVITISNWNKPNRPLTIQGIYNGISLFVSSENMLSCERSIFDRSDTKLPSYGIISNSGTLSFLDRNKEVLEYIEQGLLSDDGVCTLYMENSLTKKKQKMGVFFTSKWDYNHLNHEVKINLIDRLELLQNITSHSEQLENNTRKNSNNIIIGNINVGTNNFLRNTINQLNDNGFVNVQTNILSQFKPKYAYMENTSLWNKLNKFAYVLGLHIYTDNNGNINIIQDSQIGCEEKK